MRIAIICLLTISSLSHCQDAAEKQKSIDYVQSLRNEDGSYSASKSGKDGKQPAGSLRSTLAPIRILKYFGGELKEKEKTIAFLKSCYDKETGTFRDTPGGTTDVPTTAVGMMAIAELVSDWDYSLSVKYLAEKAKTFEEKRLAVAGMEVAKSFPPVVSNWLKETFLEYNDKGTFGKEDGIARQTGSIVAMHLRSGATFAPGVQEKFTKAIRDGQRTDGGFGKEKVAGSDLETTYRVMRALYLMHQKPADVQKLREFMAKCRNRDGGYGVEPGQPSTAGATYYVAIIGYWLEKLEK